MQRTRSFLVIASLAMMSLAWTQEYTLKINVKEGDTYKYKMTMDIDFSGQQVVFSATLINKVIKVDSEGNYTMESSQEEAVVKFGDQEMPAPPGPAVKATYRPNGALLKLESESNPTSGNFTNITFPDKPIKVGDKWEHEFQPSKDSPKIKFEYEAVAVEKINDTETVKIKLKGKSIDEKESSTSFDGHAWIDPKTGMMVRTVMTIKGLPAEGAPAPIDGTLRMELVK